MHSLTHFPCPFPCCLSARRSPGRFPFSHLWSRGFQTEEARQNNGKGRRRKVRRNVRASMANIGNLDMATGEKETTSRISSFTRGKKGEMGEVGTAGLLCSFFLGGGRLPLNEAPQPQPTVPTFKNVFPRPAPSKRRGVQ